MPDLVDGEGLDENWHLWISRFAIGHLRGKVAFCALGNERAKVCRRDREPFSGEAIAEAPAFVRDSITDAGDDVLETYRRAI